MRRRPLPIINHRTHEAYLYCIGRARDAARSWNKDAALFWGRAALRLGEALEYA